MAEQQNIPIQPVDKPVICGPYDEPDKHWQYDPVTGVPHQAPKRRKAGYYYQTARVGSAQADLFEAQEQREDLPLVNALREDVARWRESGYRGASEVTKTLLRHWAAPRDYKRLFFCQREAAETLIYLAELRLTGRSSRTLFKDFTLTEADIKRMLGSERPADLGLPADAPWYPTLVDDARTPNILPLRRMACKMATGSGKTIVMGMLIAWAFCNRGTNPDSEEFPGFVLICCPNLTVKERLQVLRPEHPESYYKVFDLLPEKYRPLLGAGKVLIENWHHFQDESPHKEGDRAYKVVDKGPETPETLGRRVIGDEGFARMPIMVLNDEGHHCWRPAPETERLTGDEKKAADEEREEARIWLSGLDQINSARGGGRPGIACCIDLSATPFYIKGSGHPEGLPFPWIVSDFGLVDAIESGIVKIPRLPVKDESKRKDEAGRPDPQYFRLWKNINLGLAPTQKHASGKPKADVVYTRAHGALLQIAGQWVERFKQIQEANPNQEQIPPVLIIVCDNTEIADVFFRKISGERDEDVVTQDDLDAVEDDDEDGGAKKRTRSKKKTVFGLGEVFPEYLSNTRERRCTIRIDSKLLAEAESDDPNKSRQVAAEELRKVVATVGRRGEPGEHVRCVVSVSMLTEGWDASNVTHVLGVRAFESQLLCEQVVGRGLRRINYDPDKATGWLPEEYVDVYGIPFSVIPFKGRPTKEPAPEDKPRNHVRALPDRAELEIRIPQVNGYVFALRRNLVRCDVDGVEKVEVDSRLETTTTFLSAIAGYQDQAQRASSGFGFVKQNRRTYYESTHLQAIQFQLTQQIIDELLAPTRSANDAKARVLRLQSRHQLFPQVFAIVEAFTRRRVVYNGVDERELGLEQYARTVVRRLVDAIEPDASQGEPPLLPTLDRYRPFVSTGGVDFFTLRPVVETFKSHINLVVLDSGWEKEAASALEHCPWVTGYARNDHLGLAIAYDYLGADHAYGPDFIVRLTNGLLVMLEVKGYEVHEPQKNEAKWTAARRWISAVNNLGEFGTWEFIAVRSVPTLGVALEALSHKQVQVGSVAAV